MSYRDQPGWKIAGNFGWSLPPGTRQRDIDRVWEAPDEQFDDECQCGHRRDVHVVRYGCCALASGVSCLCDGFCLAAYEPDPDEERDEQD
jgi:hypothetical protein